MKKNELNFFLKIRSGKQTPLNIKVSYNEGNEKKSMLIFDRERYQGDIANLIQELLDRALNDIISVKVLNKWLDDRENQ